jgi:transcriptional regulator
MYLPKQFEETRTDLLHRLIHERSFGTLVAMTTDGLSVDHLPFLLDEAAGSLGVLRGHVSRANPVVRATLADAEAVTIFQGPDHYISPSWYPTKRETGKVVPTWNYVVVHAYARLQLVDDQHWLRQHVEQLTARHESARNPTWKVGDAPEEFVAKLLGGIVGIEMRIVRLSGKWKLGQNRPPADRGGMVDGLLAEGASSAYALAGLIRDGGVEER